MVWLPVNDKLYKFRGGMNAYVLYKSITTASTVMTTYDINSNNTNSNSDGIDFRWLLSGDIYIIYYI